MEDMSKWVDGVYPRTEECPYCHSRITSVAIHGAIRQWWCQSCGRPFMPKFEENDRKEEPMNTQKAGMPEHFRFSLHCEECSGGLEADGHYSMSCLDVYIQSHIETFGHRRYRLEIHGHGWQEA